MRRVVTALVTPFAGNKIDFDSLYQLIEAQNQSDVVGVVALGTTAESNLLTDSERLGLLRFVKDNCKKKVIAGISAISTNTSMQLAQSYSDVGVDALLVTTPYYVGCSKMGLVKHYEMVYKCCKTPLILYNVPHRTKVDVNVDSVVEISKRCNLLGVKECSNDDKKLLQYRKNNIKIWCGNDCKMEKFEQLGYVDSISVTSNLCPNLTVYGRGNKTLGSFARLCAISNPSVVKYALFCAGLIKSCQVRLPLTTPTKGVKRAVADLVKNNWETLR